MTFGSGKRYRISIRWAKKAPNERKVTGTPMLRCQLSTDPGCLSIVFGSKGYCSIQRAMQALHLDQEMRLHAFDQHTAQTVSLSVLFRYTYTWHVVAVTTI